MSDSAEFLGKGIAFPFGLDRNGNVKFSELEQCVEESIYIILSTKRGERIMNPDFGCQIHDLLFEDNTPTTHALAEEYVKDALTEWEGRITLLNVEVTSPAPDKIIVDIEYQINDRDSYHNYVYPFYLVEAPKE
jgi:phage baseplate assembly protein W